MEADSFEYSSFSAAVFFYVFFFFFLGRLGRERVGC